ncbi:TolC family protein [uncultured Draconibacterium sp.]|uniref:TolC family protein n=1 Tax=uncultured Draconibacterium sp. TaxID=1573823 RepID=UPI0032167EF1
MIQSIKYIISTFVFFATVLGTVSGQNVMTLEECRKQAVEFNKELKQSALQNKEALANQEVARTAYLPSVSGKISLTHSPGFDGISMPGYFMPTAESVEAAEAGDFSGTSDVWSPGISLDMNSLTLVQSGLSVSQPVYAGGKIKNSNKQADAGVAISDLALNMTYSQVIESTDQAFWNVAMVQSSIKIAEEYIKMLTELEDQMTAMYEVGLQPASEKLKVSVQKNEAKLNLLKAKNGLRLTKMSLNQILGQDLGTDIQISYDETANVNLFNLNNGTELAANKRNELKILEKQKEISELDAKITRADYLPTVGVGVQYTNIWVKDLYENSDFRTLVAAQVSIPIFQWGQGKKKQRAAQLRIDQAENDLQHTNDLIKLEVMQVQVQVEEAYESILLAQENIDEAKESLEETQASFEVGLNTTTDLLNAQAQWQDAQAQLIQAVARFNVLKTSWERVTGNLYIPGEDS